MDGKKLSEKILEWGAAFGGYSNVKGKLDSKYSALPYCITIGVRLSDFVIEQIHNAPTYTYFHHYRTANFVIDQITFKLMQYISAKGYNAMAVPASQTVHDVEESHSGIFQHKTGACMAGLGYMGKSGLFLSYQFGPRVRLGSVLTDMELGKSIFSALPVDTAMRSRCDTCELCVKACPAGAIKGRIPQEGLLRDELIDAKACSEYMYKNFKHIGRGSVCGICIKVCPVKPAVRIRTVEEEDISLTETLVE